MKDIYRSHVIDKSIISSLRKQKKMKNLISFNPKSKNELKTNALLFMSDYYTFYNNRVITKFFLKRFIYVGFTVPQIFILNLFDLQNTKQLK